MQKRTIKTEKAPAPGGAYSQAIVAGNFVFTAGMTGVDPKTGEAPKGVAAQTKQTMLNLKATLEAAGTSLENVVRTNAYLRNISDFKEYNAAYLEFYEGSTSEDHRRGRVGQRLPRRDQRDSNHSRQGAILAGSPRNHRIVRSWVLPALSRGRFHFSSGGCRKGRRPAID